MLHVFLYISELFISVIGIILKVIKEVAEEFLFSLKADGDRDRGSVYLGRARNLTTDCFRALCI